MLVLIFLFHWVKVDAAQNLLALGQTKFCCITVLVYGLKYNSYTAGEHGL